MKLSSLNDIDMTGGLNIALMGMSGVGKTHISSMLRRSGEWYHYSVDYRLGSQYLAPHINDLLRAEAMKNGIFARLLRADAMTLRGKYGINNLDVMTDYLGKVGDQSKGGITRELFLERQQIHLEAETAAMSDVDDFSRRARDQYGYPNFIVDCSGSFCSVVDPWNPADTILGKLAARSLLVYLDIEEADVQRLIDRFRRGPKPIYYSAEFFEDCEIAYLESGQGWDQVDPDDFATWAFQRIVEFRLPRYRAIARDWGYSIPASSLNGLREPSEFVALLERTIKEQP